MPLDSTTIIEKRASEKLLVAMDFGSWLSSGETINTVNSVVATGDGSAVTAGSGTISGSRIIFFLEEGQAGYRYAITVSITTSSGQILVGEGPLKVI
jgi:hypothetical protein